MLKRGKIIAFDIAIWKMYLAFIKCYLVIRNIRDFNIVITLSNFNI